MIKGKEGIALVLAVVFMLAITILLTAVLLLSTQEINATQVYLDGNKAFYYAEAAVEYAQARILRNESQSTLDILNSSDVDNSLRSSFNVNYLDLRVRTLGSRQYEINCEVRYNKAKRKVSKRIFTYSGIWENVLASNGNIRLINPGQNKGNIVIEGNLASNGSITINGEITVTGERRQPPNYSLNFPSELISYYRSRADRIVTTLGELKSYISSNPVPGSVVYVEADNLEIMEDLIATGITIVFKGNIHIRNTQKLKIDGGNRMCALIANKIHINNVDEVNFNRCIVYAINDVHFNNIDKISINNGAMYSQDGEILINNVDKNSEIKRGNWSYIDIPEIFDVYRVLSWSDTDL